MGTQELVEECERTNEEKATDGKGETDGILKEENKKNAEERKLSLIAQKILEQAETGDTTETFERLKEASDQLVSADPFDRCSYCLQFKTVSAFFERPFCLYFTAKTPK